MKHKRYRVPVRDAAGDLWLADLYASAFLVTRGHRVNRVELAGESKRLCFVFSGDQALERDYWSYRRRDKAEVCALTFVDAVYDLKALIYDSMRTAATTRENSVPDSPLSGR